MTKTLIPWTNIAITIILSLILLISITFCTHFSAKKILLNHFYFIPKIAYTVYFFTSLSNWIGSKSSLGWQCTFRNLYSLTWPASETPLKLLSTFCSGWMTVWLGLYLKVVLLCAIFSRWKVPVLFTQFGPSIIYAISYIQIWQNFYDSMTYLTLTQYGDGVRYLYHYISSVGCRGLST